MKFHVSFTNCGNYDNAIHDITNVNGVVLNYKCLIYYHKIIQIIAVLSHVINQNEKLLLMS